MLFVPDIDQSSFKGVPCVDARLERRAGENDAVGKERVLGSYRGGMDTSKLETSIYNVLMSKARLSHSVALICPAVIKAFQNRAI